MDWLQKMHRLKDGKLAINNIDVKYATESYDYIILHVFLEREILELLCNIATCIGKTSKLS